MSKKHWIIYLIAVAFGLVGMLCKYLKWNKWIGFSSYMCGLCIAIVMLFISIYKKQKVNQKDNIQANEAEVENSKKDEK